MRKNLGKKALQPLVKNVGKPYEGKPHVRFDEGKEVLRPLTYSTVFYFIEKTMPKTEWLHYLARFKIAITSSL
ncbi:hypothetical protein C8E03_10853 [Lachnotalea glycerini]|jgi:hypothetical protein|uniref:Uncharacterized protein n=1 Tax=Lachnotalea glycerini TaxID=1763509 RepID=A0A318EJS0_9FIRM|nr:hypothetical protein C8E03_10853 [Lachnotalea glycerini]